MPAQLHPLAQAANFLATGPGTPKEKLVLGGKLLWAARTLPGNWTPDLLERANVIYRGLLREGTVQKTVDQMDNHAASAFLKQLTTETVELAAAVELVKGPGRPRR